MVTGRNFQCATFQMEFTRRSQGGGGEQPQVEASRDRNSLRFVWRRPRFPQTRQASLCHLIRNATYINLHLTVESIVQNEVVSHADAVRLHGMARSIVEVSDLICKRRPSLVHRVRISGGKVPWEGEERQGANSNFGATILRLMGSQPGHK